MLPLAVFVILLGFFLVLDAGFQPASQHQGTTTCL